MALKKIKHTLYVCMYVCMYVQSLWHILMHCISFVEESISEIENPSSCRGMKSQQRHHSFRDRSIFLKVVVFTSSFIIILLSLPLHSSAAVYNITSSTPLFPNETLASSTHTFELGFFRPNGSDNQFIGLWFADTSNPVKIVWVANRDSPPLPYSDHSATLTIASDSNLRLLDGDNNILWSTNVSAASSPSDGSYAVLLDSGNLVLIDGSSGTNLWESFGDPSDTLLQNMKVEINAVTGKKQYVTSWRSESDPSVGNFVVGITSTTPPQAYTWIKGSGVPYWRSGVWDKTKFNGIPSMDATYMSMILVQQDIQQGTTYLSINSQNRSLTSYLTILPNGTMRMMNSDDKGKEWTMFWEGPVNLCEVYGTCGRFGVCNAEESPICSCLEGFVPNSVEEWSGGNWTRGCTRKKELNCERNATSSMQKQDMFVKMSHTKLPDSADYESSLYQAGECKTWCLSNCSCLAYAYVDTIGCMVWTNELLDIQQFSWSGEDLFLRLDYVDTGNSNQKKVLVAALASVSSIIILGAAICALCRRRSKQRGMYQLKLKKQGDRTPETMNSSWKEQLKSGDGNELPIFDFGSILVATGKFSSANRLGKGGFGPVYKGKLQDGKDVAVKRLSSNSGQGIEEFKNEISLISKLQHRNLVRLIGCCIEEEEKILIYEYLPNRSLDTFLFDPIKKLELNWDKRFQIIQGIARGLLYLHRDSNLRVIHRDLKASNILLDKKLNPKISDFGLARMFQGTIDVVNTQKVAGTLGYMAPEYVIGGIFSEKSDVYSFGVLLLEIVSSKKNTSFRRPDEEHVNLVSYTWKLWRESRGLDLLDGEKVESSYLAEVEKCIQVGLMCVQDQPADRPHMAFVVQMLSGEADLSQPKEPTFTFQITSMIGTPLRLSTAAVVSYSDIQGR